MNRSRERFRLARLAVAVGGLERGVSAVSGAVRISLLVWGLSPRDYGLYVTVLGFVGTAALSDFGLHFGILNAVAKARGEDEPRRITELVATGFAIYTGIATVAFAIAAAVVIATPLASILKVPPDQVRLAREIAAIGFAGMFFGMPLRVVPAALIGLQEQHVTSLFRTLAGILQVILLAVAVLVAKGSLIAIVVIGSLLDPVSSLGFALWSARHRPLTAIRLRSFNRRHISDLFGSGLVYFFTNLANLLKRTIPALVISNALSPEAVPPFSVPFALFAIALSLSDLVSGSLWPAYGEAAARGDWKWVQRAFDVGTKAALTIAVLLALLGGFCGDPVVAIWASKITRPPLAAFAWLTVWLVSQAFANAAGVLLCGLNFNRPVMWTSLAEGICIVVTSAILVRRFGVTGVAAAMALASICSALFLNGHAVPRATRRRVGVDVALYTRILATGAVGCVCAWPVFRVTNEALPLVRLIAVAATLTAAFATSAWFVVLSPSERERLRVWLTGRLTRRRA